MKIKFFVTSKENEYNQVYVRFYNGKRFDASTGTEIYVKPKHWNYEKKELVSIASFTSHSILSKKINQLELAIYNKYNADFVSGTIINTKWLKKVVLETFNRPSNEIELKKEPKHIYFYDWAVNWIDEAVDEYVRTNGKIFSEDDKKRYLTAISKVGRFEKFKGKKYKFFDYDKKLKIEYKKFLVDEEKFSSETINNLLTRFTFLYNRALSCKIPMNPEWKEVDNQIINPVEFDHTFLDENEINRIYNVDLSSEKDKELDKARDTFIIGLRSGLRVSDYLVRLDEKHLKTGQLLLKTQKTKTKVVIPIHPQVREILYKWKGLPPKLAEGKFNKDIKLVAKRANINQIIEGGVTKTIELWDGEKVQRKILGEYEKWRLIVSHTARRSLATNLYLAGVDNQTIMKVGGWSTEKQMLEYVKKHGDRASKVIADIWNVKLEPIDFSKLNEIAA